MATATTQTVSMTFPPGTPYNIVQQQFAQAVYRAIFQMHGMDTSKPIYNAPPEVFTAANIAVPGSPPIAQAAFTAAGGRPIVISAVVDGGSGKIVPSPTMSKTHITVGPEVLDPNYVPPTSPQLQTNPPTHPPKSVDPFTGTPINQVVSYGSGASPAGAGAAAKTPLQKVMALGGTAAGAAVGALAGGPVGFVVGAAAGAGLDYLRAKAK
jgi:hypothetical protein